MNYPRGNIDHVGGDTGCGKQGRLSAVRGLGRIRDFQNKQNTLWMGMTVAISLPFYDGEVWLGEREVVELDGLFFSNQMLRIFSAEPFAEA